MRRATPTGGRSVDAVVVGARCAGAATALLMARRGLRVLCLDRSRRGSDTLSTHAIMRPGVLQLARWDLLDRLKGAGTPPARSTAFHYGDAVIEIPIKPRDGVDALYSPRRTVLDALLADAAVEAGVEIVRGARVTDLLRDAQGRVSGVAWIDASGRSVSTRADIVIGADGMRSTVARLAGAATDRVAEATSASIYGYYSLPSSANPTVGRAGGNRWFYRPGVSAGAIPTNDGLSCVFASLPPARYLGEARADLEGCFRDVVADSDPGLAAEVAAAERVGKLYAFPGLHGYVRRSHGPGWALVGDAGYFKDPLTAHGITDALRDAELLARAVAQDRPDALADYQALRDGLALELFEITDRIASFEWDLDELQRLHRRLSDEMSREAAFLAALDRDGNDLPVVPDEPDITPRAACAGG